MAAPYTFRIQPGLLMNMPFGVSWFAFLSFTLSYRRQKKKSLSSKSTSCYFFLKIPICSDISKAVSSDISFYEDIHSFLACLETSVCCGPGTGLISNLGSRAHWHLLVSLFPTVTLFLLLHSQWATCFWDFVCLFGWLLLLFYFKNIFIFLIINRY